MSEVPVRVVVSRGFGSGWCVCAFGFSSLWPVRSSCTPESAGRFLSSTLSQEKRSEDSWTNPGDGPMNKRSKQIFTLHLGAFVQRDSQPFIHTFTRPWQSQPYNQLAGSS